MLGFRWNKRSVKQPSSFEGGGPGFREQRMFLQQFWREVGTPKRATQEDVDAGNAAGVGYPVKQKGEWRDVPGWEGGLKP